MEGESSHLFDKVHLNKIHNEIAGTYILRFDVLSLLLETQCKYYTEEMTFLSNPFQIGS